MLNVLTESINSENITRYMELLSNAEIFGISEGRLCAFGAFDEKTDNILGVLVTEIFPEYIRIEKLYTVPEYRNKGVAKKLLCIIIEPIVTKKIPIFIYTTDSIDVSYIQSKGFKKTDDDYCYIEGRLGDLLAQRDARDRGGFLSERRGLRQLPAYAARVPGRDAL